MDRSVAECMGMLGTGSFGAESLVMLRSVLFRLVMERQSRKGSVSLGQSRKGAERQGSQGEFG